MIRNKILKVLQQTHSDGMATENLTDIAGRIEDSLINRVSGKTLNAYASESHVDNIQWWQNPDGSPKQRDKGNLIALMHSELSECLEGERKDLMDDKLPHRKMAEVELADALIRIFDYAGAFGYDLEGAYQEKRAYNKVRTDHKHEARQAEGGKKW